MQFDIIPIQAIKSISQRSIAVHWQRLHARHGLPRFADFSPGDRSHDARKMVVWTIEEEDGKRSYRHLYGGAYLFEAFGPNASVDLIPAQLREVFEAGLDACATSGSMVYMSIATSDPTGHRIECERLLLPFGDAGKRVTHLLASLQLVSLEGTFQRHTVLRQFERKIDVTFGGRILPATRATPRIAAPRAEKSRTT